MITDEHIWNWMQKKREFSRSDVIYRYEVNRSSAWHILKKFRDKGLIRKYGTGRDTFYRVVE